MRAITQTEKVLLYLRENGSITPLDALREFGVMRLASRISDLKKQGYEITSRIETKKNHRGETVRYARYELKGETK